MILRRLVLFSPLATALLRDTLRPDDPGHLRDIVWHEETQAFVFAQLRSGTTLETEVGTGPLYRVSVNLPMETARASKGMSVVLDTQNGASLRVEQGIRGVEGIAWGKFEDTIETNGWGKLTLDATPSSDVASDVKMYSAGFLEGLLTCVRISQHYANQHELLMTDEKGHHSLQAIKKMFANEIAYIKGKINMVPHTMAYEPDDVYWRHIRYNFFQMWGIKDGYNHAAKHYKVHELSLLDMVVLNRGGEWPTLMDAYTPFATSERMQAQAPSAVFVQEEMRKARRKLVNASALDGVDLSDEAWEKKVARDGHCSAMVKVTDHADDVLVGHTTWNDYSQMMRIFKYYTFPLANAESMVKTIGMSSYPGCISSTDDFYIMDSGLVVMDTTMELLALGEFNKVQDFPAAPHVPPFMHIMAINRLASSASDWAIKYQSDGGQANTGTYNAQFMIVDYNRFDKRTRDPVHRIQDNLLWVLETIPGKMQADDMTSVLRQNGYWASFNRPYFGEVRDLAGFTAAEESAGGLYSWTSSPRALIFKNQQSGVVTGADMRRVMQSNLYPYETGPGGKTIYPMEPGHAISARFDLSSSGAIPNGGIDSKVVSSCMLKSMNAQMISGPTHETLASFSWHDDGGKEKFPNYPHIGLPERWNFDWVQMSPLGATGAPVDVPC